MGGVTTENSKLYNKISRELQDFITRKGSDIFKIEFRKTEDWIQTRFAEGSWENLISIEELSGSASEAFETVAKNLKSYPYVITYSGDDIDYITYNLGDSEIVKTFNYTGDQLTSIVLSGDTPEGIELTKTFSYTGEILTDITYT
jgi:hypothetical protein